MDIYCVIWQDAQGGSRLGWRDVEELTDKDPAIAVSVGAMLHRDDAKIIICPHVLVEDGRITEGDAEIVIPAAWVNTVTKVYTVKEYGAKKAPTVPQEVDKTEVANQVWEA